MSSANKDQVYYDIYRLVQPETKTHMTTYDVMLLQKYAHYFDSVQYLIFHHLTQKQELLMKLVIVALQQRGERLHGQPAPENLIQDFSSLVRLFTGTTLSPPITIVCTTLL